MCKNNFSIPCEDNNRSSGIDHGHLAGHLGGRIAGGIGNIVGNGVLAEFGRIHRVHGDNLGGEDPVTIVGRGDPGIRVGVSCLQGDFSLTKQDNNRCHGISRLGNGNGTDNLGGGVACGICHIVGDLVLPFRRGVDSATANNHLVIKVSINNVRGSGPKLVVGGTLIHRHTGLSNQGDDR